MFKAAILRTKNILLSRAIVSIAIWAASTALATPVILPPGVGAGQAEINVYLQALAEQVDDHSHDSNSGKALEHMAVLNLVPRGNATHVAIGDGDWFDPSTWSGGEVPSDDARVLIPDGVTVEYGGVSDARLFTVRVDGTLEFARDTNSQIIFDTIVTSPSSHLIIGTSNNPVHPDVDINLIVADNGPIDTGWDPLLLSRGIVAHGETSIHGAIKDSHEKVTDDPMEGDTSIKFANVPEGWQVGDKIVVAGTHYDGFKWDNDIGAVRHYPSEDEVRIITSIDSDGRVHFNEPLAYNHDAPRDDLFTSVANYTRNISVESENADELEFFERGHVMFMHSDDVDVRYAEFYELGRTDKSVESRDVSDFETISYDTNVQGRYALHIHKAGTTSLEDPAIFEGNAVFGSPGWGIVHHDSNALITNNATFDTFGAGYVAETGNETGAWIDNIAIYAEGVGWGAPKNTSVIDGNFDTGRGGEGFWFQGRMVASVDNVAASVNTGFVYFHRDGDGRMIEFDAALFDYPEALYHDDSVSPDHAPILAFQGNEAFATKEGLHIVKANPNQGHDVWSHLDDFTAWNVKYGAHLEYTSHYILTDFDLIGKDPTDFSDPEDGISFGPNTTEIVIINPQISDFNVGIDLEKTFSGDISGPPEVHDYIIVDPNINNVNQDYDNYDPALDIITTRDTLPNLAPELKIAGQITFRESSDWRLRVAEISGTKTDSMGTVDFPGGTDNFKLRSDDIVRFLENDGYWTNSEGQNYFLLDIHFTDRLTGQVYYETHPVYIDPNVGLGNYPYENAIHNGTQDIITNNGVAMAGEHILDTPFLAAPEETAHSEFSYIGNADETWMLGHNGDDALFVNLDDNQSFYNTGAMSNTSLTATGGKMVVATSGAEFDLGAGHSIAITDSDASVGFDGSDGGMAILEMHEGATLAFAADDGGFGKIAEFYSGAFGETPDVQSGADLGNATLSVDLSGLSAEAGSAFSLMEADEIVGVFDEAIIGGLGDRDATILIDYETDSVTLQLSAGTGVVSIETVGEETDIASDAQALWDALTAKHGQVAEAATAVVNSDEADDYLDVA